MQVKPNQSSSILMNQLQSDESSENDKQIIDIKKQQQQTQISQTRPIEQINPLLLKITPRLSLSQSQLKQQQQQIQNNDQNIKNTVRSKRLRAKPSSIYQQHKKAQLKQTIEYAYLERKDQRQIYIDDSLRIFDVKRNQNKHENQKKGKQEEKYKIKDQHKNRIIREKQDIQNIYNQSSESYESEDQDCNAEYYQSQDQYFISTQNQIHTSQRFKILQSSHKSLITQCKSSILIFKQLPLGYKLSLLLKFHSKYLGLSTFYTFRLKQTNQHLLSAKKEHFKLYTSFIISQKENYITKRDNQFIGVVEANFSGTEYLVKTNQNNIVNNKDNLNENVKIQNQLRMKINFDSNLLGYKGVRNMHVLKLNLTNKQTKKTNFQEILARNQHSKLTTISTVQPKLQKGRFRIDFHGKAKIASSKNIILQTKQNKQCFLMVKQKQDQYLIEVGYPLSIYEAFGICLAHVDYKLLVN